MSAPAGPVPVPETPAAGAWRRFAAAVFSFETLFALFLYSNHLKFFVGGVLPVDETAALFLLTLPAGAWIVMRRGLYLPGLAAVAAGLAFFAWVGLSWTWTPSRIMARQELFLLFTGGLWSLLAGALVIAPERERVVRFLLVSAVLGAVVAVAGWFYRSLYGDLVVGAEWLRLGFSSIYQLWGQMSALGGLAALAFAAFAPFLSLRQLLFLLLAGTALSFVLVAGSRLSLVGAAAGVLLLLLFLPARMGRGSLRLSPAHVLLPLLPLAGLVAVELSGHGVFATLERMHAALTKTEDPVLSRFDRPHYLATALRLWLSAPLFGVGIMGFAPLGFSSEGPGGHPHDVFAQILAETGLVGLALFALFLWACHRRVGLARLRTDRLLLAVLSVSMVPWAVALFSESLGTYWKLYAFLGLLTLPPPAVEAKAAEPPPPGPAVRPPRVLH